MTVSSTSISAVIPAYNAEGFLRSAIESALSQTLKPIEIVVVDDGSKDNTFKIASSYGPPVVAFQQLNQGPASARNLGICRSHGEWIAFLDADDTWLPYKLERQAEFTDPGVGLIYCLARGRSLSAPDNLTFEELWCQNHIVNSSTLVQRATLDQCGGFDPDPTLIGVEDYNLWLRIAAAGWRIRSLPEELCSYTPHHNSLSHQILRSSSGHFANAKKVAAQMQLSRAKLREKEISICNAFGFDCLFVRDMLNARKFLRQSLGHCVSARALAGLVASYVPIRILDWRRSLFQK